MKGGLRERGTRKRQLAPKMIHFVEYGWSLWKMDGPFRSDEHFTLRTRSQKEPLHFRHLVRNMGWLHGVSRTRETRLGSDSVTYGNDLDRIPLYIEDSGGNYVDL